MSGYTYIDTPPKPYELSLTGQEMANTYVGWTPAYQGTLDELWQKMYFSDAELDKLQAKITQLLKGVHPQGKPIVVAKDTIAHALKVAYDDQGGNPFELETAAVETIVSYIRDEFSIIENNNKLNPWVQKRDESFGIRSYAPLKIREKHPQYMMFWDKY